ncbi:unnamed protein product [Ectocarpus sp. 4 AP-2014]
MVTLLANPQQPSNGESRGRGEGRWKLARAVCGPPQLTHCHSSNSRCARRGLTGESREKWERGRWKTNGGEVCL